MGLGDNLKSKYGLSKEPEPTPAIPFVDADGNWTEEGTKVHDLTNDVINSLLQEVYQIALLHRVARHEEADAAAVELAHAVQELNSKSGQYGPSVLLIQTLTRLAKANMVLIELQVKAGQAPTPF